ncbi:MAG: type IV pilus biogenesis/stability protein PilW [Ectothiorhodospiraceae bacterium]|nr:type IV pilus biogenesis/stability protein PilW [Ectothiorhodospiraceae bacterium]
MRRYRHFLYVLLVLVLVLVLAGCASSGQRHGTDLERASEINTQLGIAYMQENNLNQAMESLQKAVDQNRRNPSAHSALAVLYERLEEYDDAERHFRRALRLDGDNSSLRNNYGRFLCNRGDYAGADEQFRQALRNPLYDRRELPLTNAGLCALRAGEPEQAADYFRRALEHAPTFPPALRRMAELQHERGEYLSARGYLQRYRDVASMDASMLWLGVLIERGLGNEDEAASYGLRLRADYPDSEETSEYLRTRH